MELLFICIVRDVSMKNTFQIVIYCTIVIIVIYIVIVIYCNLIFFTHQLPITIWVIGAFIIILIEPFLSWPIEPFNCDHHELNFTGNKFLKSIENKNSLFDSQ